MEQWLWDATLTCRVLKSHYNLITASSADLDTEPWQLKGCWLLTALILSITSLRLPPSRTEGTIPDGALSLVPSWSHADQKAWRRFSKRTPHLWGNDHGSPQIPLWPFPLFCLQSQHTHIHARFCSHMQYRRVLTLPTEALAAYPSLLDSPVCLFSQSQTASEGQNTLTGLSGQDNCYRQTRAQRFCTFSFHTFNNVLYKNKKRYFFLQHFLCCGIEWWAFSRWTSIFVTYFLVWSTFRKTSLHKAPVIYSWCQKGKRFLQ